MYRLLQILVVISLSSAAVATDCSAVICPQVLCIQGYESFVPQGQCCPTCIPSNPNPKPDCSQVFCTMQIQLCAIGFEWGVAPGDCCPSCIPSKPAAKSPCTGFRCEPGFHCEEQQVQCITTPCDPVPVCVADLPKCTGCRLHGCPAGKTCCGCGSDGSCIDGPCMLKCMQTQCEGPSSPQRAARVDCSLVRCAFPDCPLGQHAETLKGDCCPTCVNDRKSGSRSFTTTTGSLTTEGIALIVGLVVGIALIAVVIATVLVVKRRRASQASAQVPLLSEQHL